MVSSVGLVSVIVLLLIGFFLFKEAFYIFYKAGAMKVLFGTAWYPTYDPPSFGMLPLIMGTVVVTFLTAVMAIPLGIATAIYVAEIAHHRVKEFLKPLIEMLASFPSVVLGFFGMVVIAPILSNWLSPILAEKLPELLRSTNIPFISTTLADFCYNKLFIASGLNISTAALMLTVRAIPVISSIAEDALTAVPRTYREASYSLGANKWETILRVVIPASVSGLSVAVILGIGTIIGETMIVLMVAGGAAVIPYWIFDPARPMPAAIAAEMAEAPYQSLHYQALFGVGVLLLIFTFILSLISDFISRKYRAVRIGEKI
ncbi:MAG: phosphate transporter, inner rane subunit PstC [Nitrospirae bacterium]|jgi:phosphate transport system permease protein|nr:phosphate transporter, inner rane subunit PstC [Nitrospirota bacterium]MBS1232448.1 phosphate transporter, inner rane subunit PstC [Nitrospirota bacterium]